MEIRPEELQKFWEYIEPCQYNGEPRFRVEFPDNRVFFVSDLTELFTLDNLFKYAIPKLYSYELFSVRTPGGMMHQAKVLFDGKWGNSVHQDPTQALLKAIQEVFHD